MDFELKELEFVAENKLAELDTKTTHLVGSLRLEEEILRTLKKKIQKKNVQKDKLEEMEVRETLKRARKLGGEMNDFIDRVICEKIPVKYCPKYVALNFNSKISGFTMKYKRKIAAELSNLETVVLKEKERKRVVVNISKKISVVESKIKSNNAYFSDFMYTLKTDIIKTKDMSTLGHQTVHIPGGKQVEAMEEIMNISKQSKLKILSDLKMRLKQLTKIERRVTDIENMGRRVTELEDTVFNN